MNMNSIMPILVSLFLVILSFVFGYLTRRFIVKRKLEIAENAAQEMLKSAKKEIEGNKHELKLEAKNQLYKMRVDFENETKSRRDDLIEIEKKLTQRAENIDRKVDILDKKERDITARESAFVSRQAQLENKEKELHAVIEEEKRMLQRISNLSPDDAKKLLLERMESEVRLEAGIMIKRVEEEAKQEADKKAKKIIALAIQRCAAEHTVETTVSVVHLPHDDMKGRIIGREGRNIRALEIATGVDIIIDDTPEAVIISGFDMVRREIAKKALEKLISDGRIHPGRIEEVVAKAKKEMDQSIKDEGEKAVLDIGLRGVHPEVVRLLGRLRYRTSYGQNVLQHSKEAAYLMGVAASELGFDFNLARRIGLLHDLGKAVDHEVEGTHAKIGADLAKKYGENSVVINAIAAHHEEVEAKDVFDVLIQAADAISAARPGARRESLETYIKRLEKLESIAEAFKGVDKTYAIQAGREIRVIVKSEMVKDEEMTALAREITKKVEEGLEYPGQIKVTVIRETRAIEYAK